MNFSRSGSGGHTWALVWCSSLIRPELGEAWASAYPEFLAAALKTGWFGSFSQSCWVARWVPQKESCCLQHLPRTGRDRLCWPQGPWQQGAGHPGGPGWAQRPRPAEEGKQEGHEASRASSVETQCFPTLRSPSQKPFLQASGGSLGEGQGVVAWRPHCHRETVALFLRVTLSGLVRLDLWHYRSPASGASPALLCSLHSGSVPFLVSLSLTASYYLLAPAVEGRHGALLFHVPPGTQSCACL